MATASCTVLIAASDLIDALTASASAHGEVLAFADSDALRALDAITTRRPRVITLDHEFAATARGAALISRVQADPSLKHSEIRVVSEHGETVASNVPGQAPASLDQSGTRRAARYRIPGAVEVMVDGSASVLIDLSSVGAQVVHPRVLSATGGSMPGEMRFTFLVSLLAIALLFATLMKLELTSKHARMQLKSLRRLLETEDEERSPASSPLATVPAKPQ